jgi:hypothetical protein
MITLFLGSYLPHQTHQTVAVNVLPPRSDTQGYVNNLIGSYNALVDSNNPSFDRIKANFALYHAIGNTFSIIIMQTATNVSGYVTLIFVPIGGNEPNVTMDYNDTFAGQFPLSIPGEYIVFKHLTFNFTNTIIQIKLAFGISSNDITGNYMTNSKNAAQYLYNLDLHSIPQQSPNQPQNPVLAWLDSTTGHAVEAMVGLVSGAIAIYQFVWRKKPKRLKSQSTKKSTKPKIAGIKRS